MLYEVITRGFKATPLPMMAVARGEKMQARGASIPIAVDVVCGKKFDENEPARNNFV